jgi:hypothetical protein
MAGLTWPFGVPGEELADVGLGGLGLALEEVTPERPRI